MKTAVRRPVHRTIAARRPASRTTVPVTIREIIEAMSVTVRPVLRSVPTETTITTIIDTTITTITATIAITATITIITIITAIILAILSICIFQILSLAKFNINYVELPILKILEKNKIQQILYSIVVVIAIFTSAISAGFGILENIKTKEKYKKAAFVLCFLSIPISYIGFGKLINIMYPVFGAIGIYQIALLCYNSKNK